MSKKKITSSDRVTKTTEQKDSFHAKLAFYISLGFWVPLFNIGLCTVGLILAIKALRANFSNPQKYGGLGYALAAMVLCTTSIVLSVIGTAVYLYQNGLF